MKYNSLLFSILSIFTFILNAQHNKICSTDFLQQKLIENNPEIKIKLQKNEAILQQFIKTRHFNFRSTDDVLKIPLVIHVIHLGENEGDGNNISDSQIKSGIQQLNDAYRNLNGLGEDIGIEFSLAIQDPNGAKTSGIVRYDASDEPEYLTNGISSGTGVGLEETKLKALSKWPKDQYYNIWIVNEINGNDGGFGTQGFAYLPGATEAYDGTVIQNTSWGNHGTINSWNNLGTTIIHELGHGLGLYHTFNIYNQGDTLANGCPLNTDCSTQGDFCCDTDPHMVSLSGSCDTNETNPCTNQKLGNVVRNYMDYSDQKCQVMFTNDQKNRMRGVLQTTRKSLLTSKALQEPIAECVSPIESYCTPQTQSDGLSAGYAGIGTFEIENKIINISYTAHQDNGYLDKTSDCAVTAFLNPDSSYKVKILPAGGDNITNSKMWIDYNNNGDFNNDELVFQGNYDGIIYDSTTFMVPGNVVQNQFLRLRISLDIEEINGPCDEPRYGQVEDYSIYFYIPDETNSINEVRDNISHLEIYPNPTSSILRVKLNHIETEETKILITDIQGRLINQFLPDKANKTETVIDVSQFQKGIYHLSIQNNEGLFSQNFVIK